MLHWLIRIGMLVALIVATATTAAAHNRLEHLTLSTELGNQPRVEHRIDVDVAGQMETKTEYDAWHRPVKVEKKKSNDPTNQVVTQQFFYDAIGRLDHVTDKGTTTYKYDVMGRRTEETRDGVAVPGNKLTTTTTYDIPNRRNVVKSPGGSETTTTLDKLGRTVRTHTTAGPGSSDIDQYFAYDLDGNRVYQSDGFTSSATAYDAHGRAVGTKYSDGTMSTTEYDTWSVPKIIKQFTGDSTPALISQDTLNHTDTGKL